MELHEATVVDVVVVVVVFVVIIDFVFVVVDIVVVALWWYWVYLWLLEVKSSLFEDKVNVVVNVDSIVGFVVVVIIDIGFCLFFCQWCCYGPTCCHSTHY